MRRSLVLLALLPVLVSAEGLRHFSLVASLEPARKRGAPAHVAVTFRALDPDLRLNESPAPHLTLDLEQTVLVDKQAPADRAGGGLSLGDYDPLTARYHDLTKPVLFPVGIAPTAPKGEQLVKASVVFFYCSQRESWCRRGESEIAIPVVVR